MKKLVEKVLILLFCIFLLNCDNEDEIENEKVAIGCDETSSNFKQLYSNLASTASYQDITTMDLETHSYSFEVLTNKTICKIGYQSLPNFNSTPYLIEIYDNTTSTMLYSGSHLFDFVNTSYINLSPIQLLIGHSYTIKRIQTNWNGDIANTIGRLLDNNGTGAINFPIVYGDLKITGSSFYGAGGPGDNIYLPYIDIVFQ